MSVTASTKTGRAIGPLGTLTRFGLSIALVSLATTGVLSNGVSPSDGILGLVVFPASLLLLAAARLRFTRASLRESNLLTFCLNFAIGFALFAVTPDAFALFIALSLGVAAVRGYAGCEVLAVSNWLLRRDDEVGCVIFTPIDSAERMLSERASNDG